MVIGLLPVLYLVLKESIKLIRRSGQTLQSQTATQNSTQLIPIGINTQNNQHKTATNMTKIHKRQHQNRLNKNVGKNAAALKDIEKVQVITFDCSADKDCCRAILGKNVQVIGSAGTHGHGSSKVKLKNVVDYKWEVKNYPGHLIAVHMDGEYIAYAINVPSPIAVNNKSRMEGMIRVTNVHNGSRALVKGMLGDVLDLQFANIYDEHVLASIDINSIYIHKIYVLDGTLVCNLILKVEDPLHNYTPKYDKISWCPFVKTPGDDDDDSKLIVWARGSTFQVFNVNIIVSEYGMGSVHSSALTSGYMKFRLDNTSITWVSIAPDGSTLSVGSTDGYIRFYQLYMHDDEPRCLHQWQPHKNKPISSFFFLDNLNSPGSRDRSYWKYAITGANNNTEFKVWDCSAWQCMQTVSLATAGEDKNLRFIAELDRTASCLVLSNLETRICYILQVSDGLNLEQTALKGAISNEKLNNILPANTDNPLAYFKNIAEFPLHSGILSFSIVHAVSQRFKRSSDNYLAEEFDDFDEDEFQCVVVHMFIVQSKSLQECRILYQPTVPDDKENDDESTSSSSNYQEVQYSKEAAIAEAEPDSSSSFNETESDIQQAALDASADIIIEEDEEAVEGETDGDAGEDAEDEEESSTEDVTVEETTVIKTKLNPLEVLLGIAASGKSSPPKADNPTGATPKSQTPLSIVSVAAAASEAPSVIELTNESSQSSSPRLSASSNYGQLNLLTPDAFASTSISAVANAENKTPDCVSTEVLNTILMLANVAGAKNSAAVGNPNLMNAVDKNAMEEQEKLKIQKNIALQNNCGQSLADFVTSGSSSPSREVQEILCVDGYGKSSYSGDDEMNDDETLIPSVTDGNVSSVQQDITLAGSEISVDSTDWIPPTTEISSMPPPVPITVTTAAKTKPSKKHINVMSQSVNLNSNSAPKTITKDYTSCGNIPYAALVNPIGNELNEMNNKMNKLIDLMEKQSSQINSLQKEVSDLKKAQIQSQQQHSIPTVRNMSELSFKLEIQLSKLLEQYLKRYENEHQKKLTAFMAGKDQQNREMRDSMVQLWNQFVCSQIGEVVSKVFAMEAQRIFTPLLMKVDGLHQQINNDMAQKFAAFDMKVKDNITNTFKSKVVLETLGKSVLTGVQGSLQAAFIESMSTTLVPAYEKSSQNMFKQLHDAFTSGIREFMKQLDNLLLQMKPFQDTSEDILNRFINFSQHYENNLTSQSDTLASSITDVSKVVKNLEILLIRQVQETIRVEMRKAVENQTAVLRSQANTPAPTYDLKESIKHLITLGQINSAFHQALLANDLKLVEFALKNTDHNAVFTPNCCLEQKVLLSLIQQISADMSTHNELKQNYLADALLALDIHDPIIREHAPKVLNELCRNSHAFLINFPKSSQATNVRTLLKAVEVYKDQF